MTEKIIRDPVHDVIAFRLDRPLDSLLFRLVNSAEFQRLRRIRQLGMASLAYPGAEHSRYSHCLGVMQTARRMIEQLSLSFRLEEGDTTVCILAALLHDLGHGPFSHVFERASGIDHEEQTCRILLDSTGQVHRSLKEHDSSLPQRIADFLPGVKKRTFFNDIVSSQLDADRFDYLLRDNLHTGSKYGAFDLTWLLHSLTIAQGESRLAVTMKGVSAVEAYLQSRYHMYRNVYFHKVVRTGEGMLSLALQRASELARAGRLPWPPPEDATLRALTGNHLDYRQFVGFDDVSLLHCLKIWAESEDRVLSGLCHGLLFRQLYKTIDLTAIESPEQVRAAVKLAREAMERAGGDSSYDMFYDEPADTPYEIYDGQTTKHDILVQDAKGRLSGFAAISPLTQSLSRQLMFRRLHVAEPYRNAVRQALADYLP